MRFTVHLLPGGAGALGGVDMLTILDEPGLPADVLWVQGRTPMGDRVAVPKEQIAAIEMVET
jgi:hypothetical protein